MCWINLRWKKFRVYFIDLCFKVQNLIVTLQCQSFRVRTWYGDSLNIQYEAGTEESKSDRRGGAYDYSLRSHFVVISSRRDLSLSQLHQSLRSSSVNVFGGFPP